MGKISLSDNNGVSQEEINDTKDNFLVMPMGLARRRTLNSI